MKKHHSITLLIIITSLVLFMSCTYQQSQVSDEVTLSDLKGSFCLYDYSEFGVWYLTIAKSGLPVSASGKYLFQTAGKDYELQNNSMNDEYARVCLPERLSQEQILNGIIKPLASSIERNARESFEPAIEKVIIKKNIAENDTNLYELTLLHYLDLKDDGAYVFDSEDHLIRPLYVKSTEENAYSLQRYYDARQASVSQDVDGAFKFLKDLEDYEQYIFFENPNRINIENATVVTSPPDERDRLRQLGEMGTLSADGKVYDITDGTSQITAQIKKGSLNPKYKEVYYLKTQVKGNQSYTFSLKTEPDIFEIVVPHTDTDNVELIKNSRISAAEKILLYSGAGVLKDSYNSIKEAVAASVNGDTIKVTSGTYFNHYGQVEISAKELTIESTGADPFIIDLTGSDERAYSITNNASVTMKNTQIKNINASTNGGAVYVQDSTLTTLEATFSNNTANFGASVYVKNGGLNCVNSCFADNNSDKVGGAFYIESGIVNCTNTTIKNNRACGNYGEYFVGGAGVFIGAASVFTADHTVIDGNYCLKDGGGVYTKGIFTLSNSTVTNNRTDWSGGAVFVEAGTLNIINSLLKGNSANENHGSSTSGWGGGAVMVCKNGTVNATDTIITSNTANTLDGGGISLGALNEGGGTLNANSLLVSGNAAGKRGGGIYIHDGTISTNGHVWSDLTSKQEAFSVDANGDIVAYNESLPVRVTGNTAPNGTAQMGR